MNEKDINKLKNQLPAIPGINGREDYLNSAVLVPIMMIGGSYHFVFQKRSKRIRQGGEICFPGGKYDSQLDNNMQDTALREMAEEMGILESDITLIGPLDMVISPIGAIVEPYLGIVNIARMEEFNPNEQEVEKVFTLPVDFFKQHSPEIYKAQIKVHPSYTDDDGKEIILFPSNALGLGEVYTKPWGRGENTIYVYKTPEGIIWGLTAKIIYDAAKRFNI